MSGKAAKVCLTEKQRKELQKIKCIASLLATFVQRAAIILLAFKGMLNSQISELVGNGRKQVGVWHRRWQQSHGALIETEYCETHAEFRRTIEDVLTDAPRSGCPGKFTAEQVTRIVALACETPENSNRPIDNWTRRELTNEVIKRQIVTSISKQPHRKLVKPNGLKASPKPLLAQHERDSRTFESWMDSSRESIGLVEQSKCAGADITIEITTPLRHLPVRRWPAFDSERSTTK